MSRGFLDANRAAHFSGEKIRAVDFRWTAVVDFGALAAALNLFNFKL